MRLRCLGVLCCLLAALPVSASCLYRLTVIPLGYASFVDASGQVQGFYPDLYRELARRSQCTLLLETLPAERARAIAPIRPSALRGPVGNLPAPKREEQFVPLAREPMGLVLRADSGVSSLADALKQPRLVFGVIRGVTYGVQVDRLLASLPPSRVDISVDAQTVYRKLEAGRIAATFGNAYVYRWYFDQSPGKTAVHVLPVPGSRSLPVGVVLDARVLSAGDLVRLRRELEAIRDEGLFEQMMARYLGAELARERQYHRPRPG